MRVLRGAILRAASNEFVLRYVLNGRSVRDFRRHRPVLDGEALRVLKDLDRDGVSISHVERFPELTSLFDRLRDISLQVERRRRQAVPVGSDQARTYAFTNNILGAYPKFDAESVFAQFACHPVVLSIINSYVGMFCQLRKYAVFRNVATGRSVNADWHRDGETDAWIVRLFAYFGDVDTLNGATRYAPGTHKKGPQGSQRAMTPEELEAGAIDCNGVAGTLVFADTRGYHCAGRFDAGQRWVFNSLYTTPGFGADYFTRRGCRRLPESGNAFSWATSSPLQFGEGLLWGALRGRSTDATDPRML